MIELRDYQLDALKRSGERHAEGVQRQLMVMATGLGKTICFSQIPAINPGKTVVLAHREELLKQAGHKIQAANPELYIGIEQAEKHAHPDCDVILASVATIGRMGSKRLAAIKNVKNLIVDEAHHVTAKSYQIVLQELGFDGFSIKEDPSKLLLGVTATPRRSDNIGLEKTFDEIVYSKDLRDGILDGWLVDIVADKIKTNTSLDGIAIQKGDFKEGELNERVDNDERNIAIVRGYIDHVLGKKAIVFCAGVDHVRHITDLFCREGVKAEMIVGETDKLSRQSILTRFKNGQTTVLVGCMVFTEGFDAPDVECIIMARPTKSQTVYIQQLGRGLRTNCFLPVDTDSNDRRRRIEESPKPVLRLLDVVDNTTKHTPVMLPLLFGLNPKMKLKHVPVMEAVQRLEQAKREVPNIDIGKITDITKIDKIKTEALRINIWDSVALAKEVIDNSRFSWQKWDDGSYRISLDKHESLILKEDTLGKWEAAIEATAEHNGTDFIKCDPKLEPLGQDVTIEGIFTRADRFIESNYPDLTKIIVQHASWHNNDASPKQYKLLSDWKLPVFQQDGKFFINDSGKKIPLTKGLAGKLITKKLSDFKQKSNQHTHARTGT